MERCKKCLLPDTLPGSDFNAEGECHWCQTDYPNYYPKGEEHLEELVSGIKGKSPNADCLVGLSGGKDSAYSLYRMVTRYGLRAEAFTYVHDGSTAFSVENAKRVCEKLGVKHHVVQLKNHAHLQSFIGYFKAWLEHPSTVSAGMTCVACKHFHILGSQIATERKIPLIVWANCPLEYAPFLAIKLKGTASQQFKRDGLLKSGMGMLGEMTKSKQFITSFGANFRTSLLGCLAVYPATKYLATRYPKVSPLMFYSYEKWDPTHILQTIKAELSWEIPKEVGEDWHSDCLFNILKEYMYQKMMGITYTDAFLSNQIRYGYITKEAALQTLAASKKQFKQAVPLALKEIGLSHLESKIDLSCFDREVL